MRAIIALLVVFVSVTGFAQDKPGFSWLMDYPYLERVDVTGSESLDLPGEASLAEVLERLSEVLDSNLFQSVTVDLCRRGSRGVRCSVIFKDKYLLEYSLLLEDGRYEVISPARIFISN